MPLVFFHSSACTGIEKSIHEIHVTTTAVAENKRHCNNTSQLTVIMTTVEQDILP
jgi:hypothetical protein